MNRVLVSVGKEGVIFKYNLYHWKTVYFLQIKENENKAIKATSLIHKNKMTGLSRDKYVNKKLLMMEFMLNRNKKIYCKGFILEEDGFYINSILKLKASSV